MRKKLGAKLGSLFLSICMVATLFSGVSIVHADTNADQIGSYYETYKVNGKGQIDTAGNTASDTSKQTIEDGLVKMEKKIEATGEENLFDVTLKVTTQEDLQTFDRSPDAAVVFVMDTSNSMKYDMAGNEYVWSDKKHDYVSIPVEDQRITKAKAAANKFLESYVKDADDAKRLISVVEFGSNAQTVAGWTDINSASALEGMKNVIKNDISVNFQGYKPCDEEHTYKGQKSFWIDAHCSYLNCNNTDPNHKHCTRCGALESPSHDHFLGFDFKSYWEDAGCSKRGCDNTNPSHTHEGNLDCKGDGTHQISLGKDGGGTNIEAGLMLAKNLLGDSQLEGITNLYVVLLTDGVPTYHVADDKDGNFQDNTSTTFISGERGGGNEAVYKDYKDIPGIAGTITEDKDAELFSIFYGTTDQKVDSKTPSDWLDTFVSQNYDAENSDKLELVLEKISTTIKNMAEAWKVTDPMGDYMIFDQEYNRSENGIYIDNTGAASRIYDTKDATLYWNLRKEEGKPHVIGNGVTEYTYTLTYRVKLDTLSAGFEAGAFYPVNKETKLDYMLTREDVKYDLKTAFFKTPTVKGYAADLNLKKIRDFDGNALPGAEFAVYTDGEKPFAATTSSNDGTLNFDLPSGHIYTLKETKAPEGYELSDKVYTVKVEYGKATVYDGTEKLEGTTPKISNQLDSKKMDLEVVKEWKGTNGEVPSIDITLKKTVGGTTTNVETVTLTKTENALPDGDWSYTFEDLPTVDVETGSDIIYSVEEAAVNGYKPTYGAMEKVTDQGGQVIGLRLTITNVASAKTSVTVQKDWISPENMQQEVEVELLYQTSTDQEAKSFEPAKTVTLNEANDYQDTISDLDKFDGLGQPIRYYAKELTDLDGFDDPIPSVGSRGEFIITNQVSQEKVSVNGSKVWNDNSNAYESRPESITVELYKDGEPTGETKTLPAIDPETQQEDWSFSFTGLDKYALGEDENGHEIAYSVKEAGEDNGSVAYGNFTYRVDYSKDSSGAEIIVNTLAETTDVRVTKDWKLAEDTELRENAGVTVSLLQNNAKIKEARLDNACDWTHEFKDLPVYDSTGTKYTYTVTEEPVEGFTPSTDVERDPETNEIVDPYHLILTNTDDKITDDNVSITVTKQWFDANAAGRPASISFNILANGTATAESPYTMDAAADNWSKTIDSLPKYDSTGKTIVYTVEEINVDSNYEANGEVAVESGNAVLENVIRQDENVTVSGSKVWVDGSNTLEKRPESVTIILKADGEKIDEKTLNASDFNGDTWEFRFEGLDKYKYTEAEGKVSEVKEIVYTVDEETVTGYTKSISGNTITNTLTGVVNVPVTKEWVDGSDNQGRRPESVTIVLEQYNGEALVDGNYATLTLSGSGNTWSDTATFANLPRYSEDKTIEYNYKIKEVSVPEGYASKVDGNTITNTLSRTIVDIPVSKQWIGPVPENTELEMVLYRTTDASVEKPVWEEVQTLTLPVMDGEKAVWTDTAKDLPMYDQNYNTYTYKVVEKNTPSGYTASYNGFIVTNTVEQELITVSGQKYWREIPDGSNYLPSEITIELLANGTPIQEQVTAADKNWEYSFDNLKKYDLEDGRDGKEITYSVREKGVSNGMVSFGQKDDKGYDIRFRSSSDGYDIYNDYISPEVYSYRVTSTYTTITDDVRGETERVVGDAEYGQKGDEVKPNPADYAKYKGETYTLVSATIDKQEITAPEGGKLEDALAVVLEQAGHEYSIILNYELKKTSPPPVDPEDPIRQSITVNYLEDGTGKVLASPSKSQVDNGGWYNVEDNTARSIDGYELVRVDGDAASGYAYSDIVIDVYYKQTESTEKYYSITVNYLDEASGEAIASSYVTTEKEGESYNVTSQDQIAIDGYEYVRTEGDALAGTVTRDMVINVYYSELTDIDDGDVPLGEDPFDKDDEDGDDIVDIEDGDVPKGEDPFGEDGDDIVDIEDGDVPKGENPDIPNTGDDTNKGLWFSLFGISAISLAVLLFGKKRKQEEE